MSYKVTIEKLEKELSNHVEYIDELKNIDIRKTNMIINIDIVCQVVYNGVTMMADIKTEDMKEFEELDDFLYEIGDVLLNKFGEGHAHYLLNNRVRLRDIFDEEVLNLPNLSLVLTKHYGDDT